MATLDDLFGSDGGLIQIPCRVRSIYRYMTDMHFHTAIKSSVCNHALPVRVKIEQGHEHFQQQNPEELSQTQDDPFHPIEWESMYAYDISVADKDGDIRILTLHPTFNQIVEQGLLAPNSLIQINEAHHIVVPRILERRESYVITRLSENVSKVRIPEFPQQELCDSAYNISSAPHLANRLHYLPMCGDDLMNDISTWRSASVSIETKPDPQPAPSWPTIYEIVGSSTISTVYRMAQQRLMTYLTTGQWGTNDKLLHKGDYVSLSTVSNQQTDKKKRMEPVQLWSGIDVRNYVQGHSSSDDGTTQLDRPVLIGRLGCLGRIVHFGNTGKVHSCPFKLTFRLVDASGTIDVVAWDMAAAKFDNMLRSMVPGTPLAIQGYRIKSWEGRREISLNSERPKATIWTFQDPIHTAIQLRATPQTTLSDLHNLIMYKAHIIGRFPAPDFRWTSCASIATMDAGSGFSVAGVVSRVGPIRRIAVGPKNAYTSNRTNSASDTVWGVRQGPWYTYRWISIIDQSSPHELSIQLFSNSREDRFVQLRPGYFVGVTHLRLVTSQAEQADMYPRFTTSTPFTLLLTRDELLHIHSLSATIYNGMNALAEHDTRLQHQLEQVPQISPALASALAWRPNFLAGSNEYCIIGATQQHSLTAAMIKYPQFEQIKDITKAEVLQQLSWFARTGQSLDSIMNKRRRKGHKNINLSEVSNIFTSVGYSILGIHSNLSERDTNQSDATDATTRKTNKTKSSSTNKPDNIKTNKHDNIPQIATESESIMCAPFMCRPDTLESYRLMYGRNPLSLLSLTSDTMNDSNMNTSMIQSNSEVNSDELKIPIIRPTDIPLIGQTLHVLENSRVVCIGTFLDILPPQIAEFLFAHSMDDINIEKLPLTIKRQTNKKTGRKNARLNSTRRTNTRRDNTRIKRPTKRTRLISNTNLIVSNRTRRSAAQKANSQISNMFRKSNSRQTDVPEKRAKRTRKQTNGKQTNGKEMIEKETLVKEKNDQTFNTMDKSTSNTENQYDIKLEIAAGPLIQLFQWIKQEYPCLLAASVRHGYAIGIIRDISEHSCIIPVLLPTTAPWATHPTHVSRSYTHFRQSELYKWTDSWCINTDELFHMAKDTDSMLEAHETSRARKKKSNPKSAQTNLNESIHTDFKMSLTPFLALNTFSFVSKDDLDANTHHSNTSELNFCLWLRQFFPRQCSDMRTCKQLITYLSASDLRFAIGTEIVRGGPGEGVLMTLETAYALDEAGHGK